MKKENSTKQIVVKAKGKILAIIYKHSLRAKGVKFLTPEDYTLQLGLLEHPKGTVLKDHQHNSKVRYWVDTMQEFLFIEKGKVRVSLFDNDWKLIDKEILRAGDFMLHISGGHGFEILEKCRMIEVKQGPYPGEKIAKLYKE